MLFALRAQLDSRVAVFLLALRLARVDGARKCLTWEEKFKQVARFILRTHNMQQRHKMMKC